MEKEPEKELVELAWQELAIRLELTGEHCGWFKSWLTEMLISYARGMYDASLAAQGEREKAIAGALFTYRARLYQYGYEHAVELDREFEAVLEMALATPPGA